MSGKLTYKERIYIIIIESVLSGKILFYKCEPDRLLSCILKMEKSRQEKILNLQGKIEKYELKRAQQQVAYHRMSTFQKWIAGRTPYHHLAVEQMVYIKQPMQEIEKINIEIAYLRELATKVKEGSEKLSIRPQFTQELSLLYTEGWGVDE